MKRLSMLAALISACCMLAFTTANANPMDNLAKDAANFVNDTSAALKDTAIIASIHAKIVLDKNLSNYDISVDSNNGVVTLSGEVNSDNELQTLVQLATSTDGVKSVNTSKLMVKKSKQVFSDMAITAKVKSAFMKEKIFGDKDVSVMSVSVETKNGVVYLSGTTDNEKQTQNAIKLAQAVSGVTRVESTIVTMKK